VDTTKGNTNRQENFKKRAVGYAEGEAPISMGVHIHVKREKVNKKCVNLFSIFVCNYLPFCGKKLHTFGSKKQHPIDVKIDLFPPPPALSPGAGGEG
jgi:hypothetical protein